MQGGRVAGSVRAGLWRWWGGGKGGEGRGRGRGRGVVVVVLVVAMVMMVAATVYKHIDTCPSETGWGTYVHT